MSQVEDDGIERTKQQIRALVAEISQLSKSDLGAGEFFPEFLQRIVQALAAVGGAVWLVGEDRRLNLQCQIDISGTLLDEQSEDAQRHRRLLQQVAQSNEPGVLIPAMAGTAEGAANPTRFLLVLGRLLGDGAVEGVIEIFQRPDTAPQTQRGYLRFLTQMCELAGEWLKGRKLRQTTDRNVLWKQADRFSRMVHETLDLMQTCYTITNEGRQMIGCDRVTVAIKEGPRCKVKAISGQDVIEERSNVTRRLSELASKVCATGEPLWYEGSTEELPPQIERTLEEYVDESYTKTMTILPIRRPKSADDRIEVGRQEAGHEGNEGNEIIGALIVEQIETDLPRALLEPRIDLVYEHAARSLSNSMTHNNLFLMPVWRTLGSLSVVTKARNLPKTLAVAAGVLVLLGVLFLIPGNFRMKCEGTLQPVVKKDVFVTVPGTVRKVLVKDQALVAEGEPLIELESPDLDQELRTVEGELATARSEYDSINIRLASNGIRGLSAEEERTLSQQLAQKRSEVAKLESQLETLTRKHEQLLLRSPIAGQVLLSWSVEKSLVGRPVEPGQVLLTIADPQEPWELDLFLPEKRVGHVRAARKQLGEDLEVDYYLATAPSEQFQGTIKYMDEVTRLDAKDGHGSRVLVDIDRDNHTDPDNQRSRLRVGAKVTAKVRCGRKVLGWCWFHEAFEWVQGLLF